MSVWDNHMYARDYIWSMESYTDILNKGCLDCINFATAIVKIGRGRTAEEMPGQEFMGCFSSSCFVLLGQNVSKLIRETVQNRMSSCHSYTGHT